MGKYSQTYFVTNADMDKDYRLKPVSAIMYFQDCFAQFLTTKKLAAFDLIDKNIIWVVAEFQFEFTDELPFWSEQIKVEVWMSEITKLKMYADFAISHKGKIFAKGTSCWLILDATTHRPINTDVAASKLNVVKEYMLGEHKKLNWAETKEKVKNIKYTTNLADIDFNDHVNNKSYLHLAESTTDENFKNSHSLRAITIKFIRETFLNDTLNCSVYKTKSENHFLHKIEKDGNPICLIESKWNKKKKTDLIKDYKLNIRS